MPVEAIFQKIGRLGRANLPLRLSLQRQSVFDQAICESGRLSRQRVRKLSPAVAIEARDSSLATEPVAIAQVTVAGLENAERRTQPWLIQAEKNPWAGFGATGRPKSALRSTSTSAKTSAAPSSAFGPPSKMAARSAAGRVNLRCSSIPTTTATSRPCRVMTCDPPLATARGRDARTRRRTLRRAARLPGQD
jgi:hypothetical protein